MRQSRTAAQCHFLLSAPPGSDLIPRVPLELITYTANFSDSSHGDSTKEVLRLNDLSAPQWESVLKVPSL